VLFTISPSKQNAVVTESTLKFAVRTGMVKVKPIAAETVVNIQQLIAQLEQKITDQNEQIASLLDSEASKESKILELQREVSSYRDELSEKELPKPLEIASGPVENLLEKCSVSGSEAQRILTQIKVRCSEVEIQLDDDGMDDSESDTSRESSPQPNTTPEDILAVLEDCPTEKRSIAERRILDSANHLHKSFSKGGSLKSQAEERLPSTSGLLEEDEVLNLDGIEDLSKEELLERIEALVCVVREKEALNDTVKRQQEIIMGHLQTTHEQLFQFFKIKFKIKSSKRRA